MPIHLKKVLLNEVEVLRGISRRTFYETFAGANSAEDMEQYLAEELSADRLAAELGAGCSVFYFAMEDEDVIGYLKLNRGPCQTELKEENGLEIERIYVLKEYQGRKAGKLLLEKALEAAAEGNKAYVWLGVWEENTAAIGFYERYGFREFNRHVFRLGNDEQTDIMMRLAL
jgi:ribosomal protein S18 acetylase RimI-like enzyme